MTIRRRLAIAAAIAVAVAVAVASLAGYLAVQSQLLGQVNSALRERADAILQIARSLPAPPEDLSRIPTPTQARFGGAAGLVQLVTEDGSVRGPMPRGAVRVPLTPEARAVASGGGEGELLQDQTVSGDRLRVLTAPLPGGGAVQVARPLDEVESVLSQLTLILVAVTVGGMALAALLGLLVSRASLAPVRRFTAATESISAGAGGPDLDSRLPAGRADELGRLARSYNATLDVLQRSVETQRQLVSDASHELRTPLASLKANLELLLRSERDISELDRRELEGELVEQIDELTLLVDDVVELARRGEPEQLVDDVELSEIVAVEVERARRHSPGLEFQARLQTLVIRGVPERLARAVHNLLDNAAKWSQEGGVVEITLAGETLTVRDHGPGFRVEDLPYVFDRFYRAPEARGRRGSGLGLAIVRQTAEAHGAQVEAVNAAGGGAQLSIRFPAARQDGPARADSYEILRPS